MSVSRACVSAALRTLNAGGRMLQKLGGKPPDLAPETLIRSAHRRARLSDFGDWDVGGPLERLVRACEKEAGLTPLGRLAAREHFVSLLANLLYLQRDHAASPEIERRGVAAPVFIVGLPRTGTTVLHNLMALDPSVRAPLTWEVMYPAGGAGAANLRRSRRRTARRLMLAGHLAPDLKRIHPVGVDLPQECVALTAQAFSSALFHTLYRVPSYQDWFETDPQTQAFDMHFRMLQHLQARHAGGRWVLKGPAHLFSLTPLLARYPDARLIQLHRDPLTAMASIASLNTSLRRAFSDRVDPVETGRDWCRRWAGALSRFLERRDRSARDRFLDVSHDEILRSPLAAVERIYDYLGWNLSGETRTTMEVFLTANPRNRHGRHRYSPAAFGLHRKSEPRSFGAYRERFGIPAPEHR